MVSDRKKSKLSHEEAWDLLPWLANQTLGIEEAKAVEQHVEACALCRAELASCRRDRESLRRFPELGPAPHPVQLERLWARIDAADSAPEAAPGGPVRAGHGWRSAGAVAAVLLATGAAIWLVGPAKHRAEFHTLSDPSPTAPGELIRVVFAESATEGEIRSLLELYDGEIVGGPSALGVYTIRVHAREGGEPLVWVVRQLRSRPEIRFAEPVVGGDS